MSVSTIILQRFLLGIRGWMTTLSPIFYFAKTFLATNGAILLFHLDDLYVLKEVKSYLENYKYLIWMKWIVVNSLPFTNNKNPCIKIPSLSHIHLCNSCPLFHLKLNKFPFHSMQMLLNQVTILVRVPNESSSLNSFKQGHQYSWRGCLVQLTNMASMTISKVSMPFRATKEVHVGTFQTFIKICSKS
jgi:hypothetical protein